MDIYDSFIRIHICANYRTELERGVKLFKELLGAGNVCQRTGFWHEYDEPVCVVEHWFSSDPEISIKIERILDACEQWQQAAQQEAISIEVAGPDGRAALVVYEGEWQQAREYITALVDRGEYLANWFLNGGAQA